MLRRNGTELDPHFVLSMATSSYRGHVDESATGFLFRRAASMVQAADTDEPAAVEHYFPSPTKLFQSAYGHRETD